MTELNYRTIAEAAGKELAEVRDGNKLVCHHVYSGGKTKVVYGGDLKMACREAGIEFPRKKGGKNGGKDSASAA